MNQHEETFLVLPGENKLLCLTSCKAGGKRREAEKGRVKVSLAYSLSQHRHGGRGGGGGGVSRGKSH